MVVGLDLGTTKVCAIIAEVSATSDLNVMGVGCTPSDGLRRGVVVDVDKTVQAISTTTPRLSPSRLTPQDRRPLGPPISESHRPPSRSARAHR